ncbi:MAG TPA: anti-sigma F factor [Limnochordia bacterium]
MKITGDAAAPAARRGWRAFALDVRPDCDNQMRLEFVSRPANVEFARAAVASFAAQLPFTLDELEEIRIAVSEAVTNAVVHGYENGPGVIAVEARLRGGRLELEVTDTGRGIQDVAWAMQPTHTTDPGERMGLGLVFIAQFMEDVGVESLPGRGTRVRMAKSPGTGSTPPQ